MAGTVKLVALLAATALLMRGPVKTCTRHSIRAESGVCSGKDPASVDIRAATDRRITRSSIGVYTRRETRGPRSGSQTKTDVGIFKTKAGRAGAGNAAHHIELIGYVAAKS